MLEVPRHVRYWENYERCGHRSGAGSALHCEICGLAIQTRNIKYKAIMAFGHELVTEAEAILLIRQEPFLHADNDIWWVFIGPDCLRQHPEVLPYVISATPTDDLALKL